MSSAAEVWFQRIRYISRASVHEVVLFNSTTWIQDRDVHEEALSVLILVRYFYIVAHEA